MRQKRIMLKLSETLWTSRVITIFLLLVHYTFLLSVLETVQSKSKGQTAADASSYITYAVLLKFDFLTWIFHNGQPSHGGDRKTFEVMTSTELYHDYDPYIITNHTYH